jgi:ribosomal protein S18 acetylase RimI-like enzyme
MSICARQNEIMAQVDVSVLADVDDATVQVLCRLLAQVSSKGHSLTAERIEAVLRTPSTTILVARLDGEIVGMALLLTLTTLSRTTGYVEEVVVDEAARGQHISTSLMTALLNHAVSRGMEFVDLTSRPSRKAANGLYQSLGFRQRETNSYRHDLQQVASLSLPPCGGHPTCQAVPGGGSPDGTASPAVLAGI